MRVAIVGGGLSGSLMCMQLLRRSQHVHVTLIERRSRQLNRGVAYSARLSRQLLNVPASRMGLSPDDPEGFLRWARTGPLPQAGPDDFLPRSLFGDFVHDQFHEIIECHSGRVSIERSDAISLDHHPAHGYSIGLHSGRTVKADRVILAMGNAPPAHVPNLSAAAHEHPGYIAWPWKHGSLAGVKPDDHVLFVGAGLTMVDVMLSLFDQGHTGMATVVSRRGLLPRPHAVPGAWQLTQPQPGAADMSVLALMRWVRNEVGIARSQGVPWQCVMDAVKPSVQGLWQALGREERARFLRHVRPFWEVHRHRMPREAHERIAELQRMGQLRIISAAIAAVDAREGRLFARVIPRGGMLPVEIDADHVVNCTGPQADSRRMEQPLLLHMHAQGFVAWDDLRLGLTTTTDGALIGANGIASDALFAVGPLCKPALWECTAVPEIRKQVHDLAARLVADHRRPSVRGPWRKLIDRLALFVA